MSTESKIRTVGARKAPEALTMDSLVVFAERIIRADKNAALRAQNSVTDLEAKTNDSKAQPRISAIEELCGKSGHVKITSETDEDGDDAKLIKFCKPRSGS